MCFDGYASFNTAPSLLDSLLNWQQHWEDGLSCAGYELALQT